MAAQIYATEIQDDGDSTLGQIRAIRKLWRAVITQAMMDAGNNCKNRHAKGIKARALQWLVRDNSDFDMVCEMADMEPGYVRARAKGALERGCKWRRDQREAKPIDFEQIISSYEESSSRRRNVAPKPTMIESEIFNVSANAD